MPGRHPATIILPASALLLAGMAWRTGWIGPAALDLAAHVILFSLLAGLLVCTCLAPFALLGLVLWLLWRLTRHLARNLARHLARHLIGPAPARPLP